MLTWSSCSKETLSYRFPFHQQTSFARFEDDSRISRHLSISYMHHHLFLSCHPLLTRIPTTVITDGSILDLTTSLDLLIQEANSDL